MSKYEGHDAPELLRQLHERDEARAQLAEMREKLNEFAAVDLPMPHEEAMEHLGELIKQWHDQGDKLLAAIAATKGGA